MIFGCKAKSRFKVASLRAIGKFETPEFESQIRLRTYALGIDEYVRWVGFTNDVNAEIAQTDIMVLPSLLAEGLPMVLIESMAAGVPVVGTQVDGIVDVIRHNEDGLLAEPGDTESLAHQLHRIIHGQVDWHELRENGWWRQREDFSDHSMAKGVAKVYQEVLSLDIDHTAATTRRHR